VQPHLDDTVAGALRVVDRALVGIAGCPVTPGYAVRERQEAPGPGERVRVSRRLEVAHGGQRLLLDLIDRGRRLGPQVELESHQLSSRRDGAIVDRRGIAGRADEQVLGRRELTDLHERLAGRDEQGCALWIRSVEQLRRTVEQVGGCREVSAGQGTAARR
jgi:hypothetical protein